MPRNPHGDRLLVISNPLGLERSISEGLVSGIRKIDGANMLQISAPISPGSSGGPVLNSAGVVIGIATASFRAGQNLNLAIPSNTVQEVIGQPRPSKLKELVAVETEGNQGSGADLQKLRRYFSAEMWPEAVSNLRSATQDDEFNPYLRLALGEALFKSGSYEEAIRQLELSKRLLPGIWQVTEQLGDVYCQMWETNNDLRDRLAACNSIKSLLSHPPAGQKVDSTWDFLFKHPSDLASAKKHSQEVLSSLLSPLGTWTTKTGRTYRVTTNGIGPVDGRGDEFWFLSFSSPEEDDIPVSASGYQAVGHCLMKVSATVTLGACASTLHVEGHFTGEATVNWLAKTPELKDPSVKEVQESCERVAKKVNGMRLLRDDLTRTQ